MTQPIYCRSIGSKISLVPREIHKSITDETGTRSMVVGIITKVPVKFGELVVNIELLVVDCYTLDIIIGDTAMGQLKGAINLVNRQVRLAKEGIYVIMTPEPDYSRKKDTGTDTEIEEFTSDSSTSPISSENEDHEAEEGEESYVCNLQFQYVTVIENFCKNGYFASHVRSSSL